MKGVISREFEGVEERSEVLERGCGVLPMAEWAGKLL